MKMSFENNVALSIGSLDFTIGDGILMFKGHEHELTMDRHHEDGMLNITEEDLKAVIDGYLDRDNRTIPLTDEERDILENIDGVL